MTHTGSVAIGWRVPTPVTVYFIIEMYDSLYHVFAFPCNCNVRVRTPARRGGTRHKATL